MAELEDRVATLEAQMEIQGARDSATLTMIGGKLFKLDTKLDRVQEAITNLALKHEELSTKVDGLNTTVDGLNTTVGGLNTTVGGLNTTVGGLSTTVGGLSTTVGGLSTKVDDGFAHVDTKMDEILRRLPPRP
ncbi:hypothetical protein ACWDYH_05080 [Nocardia goodfellowii]